MLILMVIIPTLFWLTLSLTPLNNYCSKVWVDNRFLLVSDLFLCKHCKCAKLPSVPNNAPMHLHRMHDIL